MDREDVSLIVSIVGLAFSAIQIWQNRKPKRKRKRGRHKRD